MLFAKESKTWRTSRSWFTFVVIATVFPPLRTLASLVQLRCTSSYYFNATLYHTVSKEWLIRLSRKTRPDLLFENEHISMKFLPQSRYIVWALFYTTSNDAQFFYSTNHLVLLWVMVA